MRCSTTSRIVGPFPPSFAGHDRAKRSRAICLASGLGGIALILLAFRVRSLAKSVDDASQAA
jgi:hypothetical protein